MSPDPIVVAGGTRGRVLRGGVATGASSLSFPTITAPLTRAGADGEGTAASSSHAAPSSHPAPASNVRTVDPAELERLRLEAVASGYEDGFAAGHDAALVELRRTAAGLLERLDEAVVTLRAREAQVLDELGDRVLGFALATVEALLGHELAASDAPVRDAIDRALRLAPDRLPATLHVHPADVELAAMHDAPGRVLTVVADEAIEAGGCIARVEDCEVDAQIGTALRRLDAALRGGVGR